MASSALSVARYSGGAGSGMRPPDSVPPGNLSPEALFYMLGQDFRAAWKGVADRERETRTGGNFLFAGLAMDLLELACRTAAGDKSGHALEEFGQALHDLDPRYFAELPCEVGKPQFDLPRHGETPENRQVLTLLFLMIRHGLAHQYQQIPARLTDGRHLIVALSGATKDRPLDESSSSGTRPEFHLRLDESSEDPLRWFVYPDRLFLDFESASHAARVFDRGLRPDYLGPRKLELSATELRAVLG
jgi:hypothetical protein